MHISFAIIGSGFNSCGREIRRHFFLEIFFGDFQIDIFNNRNLKTSKGRNLLVFALQSGRRKNQEESASYIVRPIFIISINYTFIGRTQSVPNTCHTSG